MKRFRLLLLISVITLAFTGCSQNNKQLSLDDEFNRIKELIPVSVEEDFILPSVEDGYSIVYKINDILIEDSLFSFEQKETDEFFSLLITLSNGEQEQDYTIAFTQVGDPVKYQVYLREQLMNDAILSITNSIPLTVTSNVTLPDFSDSDLSVSYSTDCTDIIRNRIVYTYTNTTNTCTFDATIKYLGDTQTLHINYNMAALDDLPKVPSIYINTTNSSSIDSKDDYTSSRLSVTDYYDASNNISDATIGIRLRGNSTMYVPKKSYKIKFDKKSKLLSDYAEKDWVLLANYMDQTLVRDYVAFQLSSDLNMLFTPSYTPVDLYINGVYQGNYLLTDQIEVTNDRVDIEENVASIDTGYLLEFDRGIFREANGTTTENYFTSYGIPFIIKSPDIDDDHYLNGQKDYISSYIESVLYTLKNGNDYHNIIDEASFIDWYIVNEVFKNVDSGYSSVYFYKDKGSLLKMGPVWDFDLSSGAYGHLGSDLRGPTGFYTSREDKNTLFYYLMKYESFQQSLKERWNEIYDEILIELPNNVLEASNSFTASRYHNFELWDIIGKDDAWYVSDELYVLNTYDEQVWFLYDFLKVRVEWLNNEINNFE